MGMQLQISENNSTANSTDTLIENSTAIGNMTGGALCSTLNLTQGEYIRQLDISYSS